MDALIEAATSTPLQHQGTLTRQGDSLEFVAEDLDEKIRMSSPLSKRGASLTGVALRVPGVASQRCARPEAKQVGAVLHRQ